MNLTPARARSRRQQLGWSLTVLALRSGVNKAYLSEFENGHRTLTNEALDRIDHTLQNPVNLEHAHPQIVDEDDHLRLIFLDPRGLFELSRPTNARVEWIEEDGTVVRMFIGERPS